MRNTLLTLTLCITLLPAPAHAESDLQLPDLGGTTGALSLSEEKALGKEFMQAARGGLNIMQDGQIKDYLQRMGYRLLEHMNPPFANYQFILIKDPNINAFAAPGGYVVINSGLVLAADNASELASVIAHELAHINQRHISRAIDESQRMQWPMLAAMLASILLSATAGGQAGQAAMSASTAYGIQNQLQFSRDFEREADRIGIRALASAGFDPAGMPSFFEKLQNWNRLQGGSPMEFLSTHPLTLDRIADTRNRAEQLTVKQPDPGLDRDFARFKTRVRALSIPSNEAVSFFRIQASSQNSYQKELGIYGLGMALAQKGQYREAIAQLEQLNDLHPGVFEYQAALAGTLLDSGKYQPALKAFRQIQRAYPNSGLARAGLAQALLESGDGQNAANLARQLAGEHPHNAEYQQLLARALEKVGNKPDAHRALAEYYFLTGALPSAIQQLEIARSMSGNDVKVQAAINARLTEMKRTGKTQAKNQDST